MRVLLGENLKIALIILLTGVVVVFSVLVLLIFIIKGYSTAVSNAQSKIEQKKIEKVEASKTVEGAAGDKVFGEKVEEPVAADDGSVPGEIVAAIAAAVEVIFGAGAVSIKSVRKAAKQGTSRRRSAWKSAGMAENTRAF